jgi:hypothetical protein
MLIAALIVIGFIVFGGITWLFYGPNGPARFPSASGEPNWRRGEATGSKLGRRASDEQRYTSRCKEFKQFSGAGWVRRDGTKGT